MFINMCLLWTSIEVHLETVLVEGPPAELASGKDLILVDLECLLIVSI
jgi:hypothetical protein